MIQGPNAIQNVEDGLVPDHRHGYDGRNKRPAHVGGDGGMAAIEPTVTARDSTFGQDVRKYRQKPAHQIDSFS